MTDMKANSPTTLPPFPGTGPGRTPKRSGPVPAWGLKVGSFLTTLAVFAGSFGFVSANAYVTNAPLQPSVAVAETDDSAAIATAAPTTTLTSAVRTTTRTAVTSTKSS